VGGSNEGKRKSRDEKVALKDKILIPTVTGVIGVIIGFILQIIFL